MRRSTTGLVLAALLAGSAGSAGAAGKQSAMALRRFALPLPGAPAAIVAADVDADGRRDLAIVIAYTEVRSISEDRVEDMIEVMTVIPALFDRRELRIYLRQDDGAYREAGAPLPLPPSVLALAGGVPGSPLVALTDAGLAAVRFAPAAEPMLRLEPLIDDPPVLAGSGTFFSDLDWVHDLDGDGRLDVLLPARRGPTVYLATATGLDPRPRQRLLLPGARQSAGAATQRHYPLPRVEDVNGDRVPDLVVDELAEGARLAQGFHVLVGRGDGTFAPLRPGAACERATTLVPVAGADGRAAAPLTDLSYFGDIDGDGRAEGVTLSEIAPKKDGMFAELKQAKRPHQRVALHRTDEHLALVEEPYGAFEALGHAGFDVEEEAASLFRDLDGDGRKDLITVTLDFSMLQAIKVLATKRIGIGLDFHIWAQDATGRFHEVPGLDLSEKLKFDLSHLTLERLAQFAGDFDGDGRVDFVHLGRGSKVTVHRGQPGCVYPDDPDLVLELEQAPEDLGLIAVRDVDGDGRADIAITRSLPAEKLDASPPVILDLYLSGKP